MAVDPTGWIYSVVKRLFSDICHIRYNISSHTHISTMQHSTNFNLRRLPSPSLFHFFYTFVLSYFTTQRRITRIYGACTCAFSNSPWFWLYYQLIFLAIPHIFLQLILYTNSMVDFIFIFAWEMVSLAIEIHRIQAVKQYWNKKGFRFGMGIFCSWYIDIYAHEVTHTTDKMYALEASTIISYIDITITKTKYDDAVIYIYYHVLINVYWAKYFS